MAKKNDNALTGAVTVDPKRHVVTIGDQTFPSWPLNLATLRRFAEQYDGQPVPIADVEEAFAGEDENRGPWTLTRLVAIQKQLIGQEKQLVFIGAYGINGGGRKVAFRFADGDDPEAQDQVVASLIQAQAARIRATERHATLLDAAKRRGIVVPE
jgi:hypothetical protein